MTSNNTITSKKKNSNVRKLVIKDFRNIGITFDEKESPAELVLNRSLEKEDMGDLVFLVGPNNSGKSNVLAALESYGKGFCEDGDSPDFMGCEQSPVVSMIVQHGDKKIEQKKNLTLVESEYRNQRRSARFGTGSEMNGIDRLESARIYVDDEYGYVDRLPLSQKSQKRSDSKSSAIGMENSEKTLPEYEYLLSSKIIAYNQVSIKQSDLVCKPHRPTDFIKSLFKIAGEKSDALVNIYKQYSNGKNNKGYLNKFSEQLNQKLPEKVTNCFNDMYFCGEGEEYKFEIDLESDLVSVILCRGNDPIDLDKQSTGFKWFFDFFFNFAYKEDLTAGDIVIMDEPATNLHVSGQLELRQFLKDLAKKSGITFVISTHSPFLIDCDWLDELRLMQRDNRGYVTIEDKFDMVSKNADKLDPVLSSLTVGRHILTGPQKVIFTEGITDYNYLTAFKLLFSKEDPKYEDLVFLPVGGLKNDKNLVSILCKADQNPILLVDRDNAGLEIKRKSEGTNLEVILLTDVNQGHKVIENLFSKEDGEKFNIINKEWNESVLFKKNILENASIEEISAETKDNFKGVLEKLLIS